MEIFIWSPFHVPVEWGDVKVNCLLEWLLVMETGFIFVLLKEDEVLLWQDCLLPVFFLKHLNFF